MMMQIHINNIILEVYEWCVFMI